MPSNLPKATQYIISLAESWIQACKTTKRMRSTTQSEGC